MLLHYSSSESSVMYVLLLNLHQTHKDIVFVVQNYECQAIIFITSSSLDIVAILSVPLEGRLGKQ